ncbi:DUF6415 family natural product biosynthesis protein [Streptomyces sp. NPDC051018]|uniref:DUF6415 family natural product biosynthesis protein n=1 Tax=Streptomyces sp. NPDC051018 TaxID=3365639 RepID=UPI00379F713E
MTRTNSAVDDVQHLITEALSATGHLPPPTRLIELDEQLRAEVKRLVDIVQAKAAKAEPHSRSWHVLRTELGRAGDALTTALPQGPLAGSLHVAELARRACALRQAEGHPASAAPPSGVA